MKKRVITILDAITIGSIVVYGNSEFAKVTKVCPKTLVISDSFGQSVRIRKELVAKFY